MLKSYVKVIALMLSIAQAAKLPSYIEKCSQSDPNLNECFITSANKAIPHLIQGEKELRVPSFNPLEVEEVRTQQGSNLEAILRKLKIYGFDEAKVVEANIDMKEKKWDIHISVPIVNITSDYELNGKLLFLPFKGSGTCINTLIGAIYNYTMNYEFKTKKSGKEHLRITKSELVFYPKKAWSYFDNLFNGDKRLGDVTNRVMNENWKEFHKEINPVISETISIYLTNILNNLFNAVPFEDVFLP